jgi:hypothetical protein
MWLANVKASFFTKGILEAFDVIYEILGELKLEIRSIKLIFVRNVF